MGIHEKLPDGATAADVAKEGVYGVHHKRYWVDEKAGKIFCLVEARC